MALAVAYLGRTGQKNAQLEARAETYLAKGAQRLEGFEVAQEPGSFSLFGRAPARLDLSAYALMVFHDLQRVCSAADPALEQRIGAFVRKNRKPDGHYKDGYRSAFDLTAYIAWAFALSGQDAQAERAWIAQNLDEAKTPYSVALAALAFLTHDAKSTTGHLLLRRLAALADAGVWNAQSATLVGARGRSAGVETTGLAIQALLLGGAHDTLVTNAIDHLVGSRKRNGTFGPTQSTLQALRALLAASQPVADAKPTRLRVLAGNTVVAQKHLPAGRSEPLRIDLGERAPEGLRIQLQSGSRLRGTLSHATWKPWGDDAVAPGRVALTVRYPVAPLQGGRRAYAEIEIRNPTTKIARIVTAEIGIPPGCDIHHRDTEGRKQALAVERGTTSVVLYLDDLAPGQTLRFRLPFTPRYRIEVKTTPSKAYEYYTPDEGVVVAPVRLRAR